MGEINIISREGLLEARRKASVEEKLEYAIWTPDHGKERRELIKKIVAGEMEHIAFDDTAAVGELLSTPAGLDTLVQKTILDVEQGREQQPLLYNPIYRRRENRRFTKNVQVGVAGQRVRVVFLEKLEGEEVKFGTRTIGPTETVPIITYAAGLQWTEDLTEFDLTWEAEEANRAFGEAYNALLNHLHLYPILSYTYAAKNKTAYAAGATQYEKDRQTIKNALEHAMSDKNADTKRPRIPSIVVAASSNRWRIQEALQTRTMGGTIYPAIGSQLTTVILYDGWSETVGAKTYNYGGCPADKIYLVEPQRYFHELVKHDLITTAGNADVSRLIEEQVVARTRRGVYASPANGVEEVTFA